jgi:Domain of unknown function DUF11
MGGTGGGDAGCGGWYGGGGGSYLGDPGGGGSSYGGAGPSADVSISTASSTQQPELVISWQLAVTSLSYTGPSGGPDGTPVTLTGNADSRGQPAGRRAGHDQLRRREPPGHNQRDDRRGELSGHAQRQPRGAVPTRSTQASPGRRLRGLELHEPLVHRRGPAPTLSNPVHDAATGAGWLGYETPGAKAYDTATLGGLIAGIVPTRSVKYALYADGVCSGTALSSQTVALNANGSVPNSSSSAALKAGSYSYLATYSGDGNYPGASNCQPFTVVPDLVDLSVTISGPPTAADNGSFNETVSIRDAGPAPAANVVTVLIVPGGVTVKATAGGSDVRGSLIWTAAKILPGASDTYTVTFTVGARTKGTVAFPVATVSLSVPDPNYANNAANSKITLAAPPGRVAGGVSLARLKAGTSARRHRRQRPLPTFQNQDSGR